MNLKKKWIRIIIVAAIVIVGIIGAVLRFNIEPTDYGKTLAKEIKTAKELLSSAKEGNAKGEYSGYTILEFKQQITDAEEVSGDEDSYYEIEKEAYENLKESIKQFKHGGNDNVFSKEEVEKAIKDSETLEETIKFSKWTSLDWKAEGENLKEAADINLAASLEGPYFNEINSHMEEYSMQGRVLAFYHNGDFPGGMKISVDYVVENGTAYLYYYNVDTQAFDYVSDISLENSKANFTISTGGTYIILTKTNEEYVSSQTESEDEETQAGEETGTDPAQEQTSNQGNSSGDTGSGSSGKGSTNSGTTSNSGNAGGGSGTQDGPESEESGDTITVTIEIRCDTIASDLSKLTIPSGVDEQQVRNHIPSNGTILPKTSLKIKKGKNVEYALKLATRNAGIQMDSVYTALYSGQYIRGINYLYEKYAGGESGWMYKVNGWFPNYGCSNYYLENGDEIVWVYTCDLGKDVGDNSMDPR